MQQLFRRLAKLWLSLNTTSPLEAAKLRIVPAPSITQIAGHYVPLSTHLLFSELWYNGDKLSLALPRHNQNQTESPFFHNTRNAQSLKHIVPHLRQGANACKTGTRALSVTYILL